VTNSQTFYNSNLSSIQLFKDHLDYQKNSLWISNIMQVDYRNSRNNAEIYALDGDCKVAKKFVI